MYVYEVMEDFGEDITGIVHTRLNNNVQNKELKCSVKSYTFPGSDSKKK